MAYIGISSASSVPTKIERHLFLVAGQSNTLFGSALSADPDEVTRPNIQVHTVAGDVELAQEPMPSTDIRAGHIGFSLAFAKEFTRKRPYASVGIIHNGVSNTGITPGVTLDRWAPVNNDLHAQAVSRVNTVLAAHPSYRFSGILWHQGERDGDDNVDQATYATNLDLVISTFRSQITGAANVPFILGQIADVYTPGTMAQIKAAVNDTPNRVTNTAVIANGGLATFDGVHFSAASQRTMGSLYEQAIESFGV